MSHSTPATLYLLALAIALLAFSDTAKSQSRPAEQESNYNPDTKYWAGVTAQSVLVTPTTNGWEYFNALTGGIPPGDTWEIQMASTARAVLANRERESRIWTSLPDQTLNVIFVGDAVNVKAVSSSGFEAPNATQLAVFVDGEEQSSAAFPMSPDSEEMVAMHSDRFHNITFRTGPEFRGNFTFIRAFWSTNLMTKE